MAMKPLPRKAHASLENQKKKGIQYVRGGAICSTGDKSAHLIQGSGQAAICKPTLGKDTRPRWRRAGG